VFLAKPVDSSELCDWHVDDLGFWPAQFLKKNNKSESSGDVDKSDTDPVDEEDSSGRPTQQHGVNVWLALDDMPARYEGSMAVSPGSHAADWRFDAYRAIGQPQRLSSRRRHQEEERVDRDSFVDMLASTCVMNSTDPSLREKIERTRKVFNVKRGDAIFASRMLFHRVTEVTDKGKRGYYRRLNKPTLNRYSIRYVPGTTLLPDGYHCVEWSLLSDPANQGLSLDEVVGEDGGEENGRGVAKKKLLWYPQVWPPPSASKKGWDAIEKRLDAVAVSDDLAKAKEMVAEEMKALVPIFQEMSVRKTDAEQAAKE